MSCEHNKGEDEAADIWVFGYGSLVYRPGFEHSKAVQGYIKGYKRVFWQGSTDHRGTPEAPGRTVTLLPDPTAVTWGVAYRLAGDHAQQQQTLQYLEWREKQYDRRVRADIYDSSSPDGPAVPGALVYWATDGPQNVNWLGPAPLKDIAAQVASAVGPSGPNYEYVFRLADAMRAMHVEDAELFELESMVRQLLPPAVLSSIASSHANGTTASSHAAKQPAELQQSEEPQKHVDKGQTTAIQLTAVAVTAS